MYGYDILIDSNLKCWLVEVNASPALQGSTPEDTLMKKGLINDLCNIVIPSNWLKSKSNVGSDTCRENKVGMFTLLYDESQNRAYRTGSYLKKYSGNPVKMVTPTLGRKTTLK